MPTGKPRRARAGGAVRPAPALFRHLLLPLDLSARNRRTLALALGLARRHGSRVTLLHVIQRIPFIPPAELRPFYARLERATDRALGRAAGRFQRAGVPVRPVVLIGAPAPDIARYARQHRVDLLVMGSHRMGPAGAGRGSGTLSDRVSRLCSCPILLVK